MEFIAFDLSAIEKKLQNLEENSKPLWGRMSAAKMLEHLILVARVSNGKEKIAFAGKEEHLPKLHSVLKSDKPFPQNFSAPAQVEAFLETSSGKTVDALKKQLINELAHFQEHFRHNPELKVTNAVFGSLNYDEWKYFHQKHISHHLAQFNCWKY